jgi:hypothetical protein
MVGVVAAVSISRRELMKARTAVALTGSVLIGYFLLPLFTSALRKAPT